MLYFVGDKPLLVRRRVKTRPNSVSVVDINMTTTSTKSLLSSKKAEKIVWVHNLIAFEKCEAEETEVIIQTQQTTTTNNTLFPNCKNTDSIMSMMANHHETSSCSHSFPGRAAAPKVVNVEFEPSHSRELFAVKPQAQPLARSIGTAGKVVEESAHQSIATFKRNPILQGYVDLNIEKNKVEDRIFTVPRQVRPFSAQWAEIMEVNMGKKVDLRPSKRVSEGAS